MKVEEQRNGRQKWQTASTLAIAKKDLSVKSDVLGSRNTASMKIKANNNLNKEDIQVNTRRQRS